MGDWLFEISIFFSPSISTTCCLGMNIKCTILTLHHTSRRFEWIFTIRWISKFLSMFSWTPPKCEILVLLYISNDPSWMDFMTHHWSWKSSRKKRTQPGRTDGDDDHHHDLLLLSAYFFRRVIIWAASSLDHLLLLTTEYFITMVWDSFK